MMNTTETREVTVKELVAAFGGKFVSISSLDRYGISIQALKGTLEMDDEIDDNNNLWIAYFTDGERRISSIGTFKTLDKSREAMHRMAALLADFILAVNAYVNANLDDFTWEGADVYPLDEAGDRPQWGYSCRSMDAALKRKDELMKKYPQVVVRDNATRKEKVFKGAGIPQT